MSEIIFKQEYSIFACPSPSELDSSDKSHLTGTYFSAWLRDLDIFSAIDVYTANRCIY